MAVLTSITLEEAREVGRRYGRDVVSIRGLLAGSVNSNFEIGNANGERLFLRVYEEQTESTAKREASLLSALATKGVRTPEPLLLPSGESVTTVRGKPAALFPFVSGEVLCQKRVTLAVARQVGAALGAIHHANAGGALEGAVGASRFDRDALAARLGGLPSEGLGADVLRARARVEAYLETPAARPRLVGVIHGDLFRDNVLWEHGNIVALLDFESASHGSLAFDLMVTILAWCFGDELDRDLARAMTAGYLASSELVRDEIALLAGEVYAEARFACARFTTTRVTDFELRPRGTGVYKDFRRFLARMDAIERLGPDGLPRFLHLPGFAEPPPRD